MSKSSIVFLLKDNAIRVFFRYCSCQYYCTNKDFLNAQFGSNVNIDLTFVEHFVLEIDANIYLNEQILMVAVIFQLLITNIQFTKKYHFGIFYI